MPRRTFFNNRTLPGPVLIHTCTYVQVSSLAGLVRSQVTTCTYMSRVKKVSAILTQYTTTTAEVHAEQTSSRPRHPCRCVRSERRTCSSGRHCRHPAELRERYSEVQPGSFRRRLAGWRRIRCYRGGGSSLLCWTGIAADSVSQAPIAKLTHTTCGSVISWLYVLPDTSKGRS